MNSNFWRASLTFPPHLKPLQLRDGAIQVTLEMSLVRASGVGRQKVI
jgi:hypothetical protein